MKKLFLLAIAFIGFTALSNAQDFAENALGLRLGDSDGFGAEISYQRALGGDNNRLELDLGWRSGNNFDGFKLAGIYQWVWNLDGDFNWYAGVGGGLTSFSGTGNNSASSTGFFGAGDVGVEYNFEIPLQLSLDFRPEIGNNDFTDNAVFDIALGIRYQF